MMENEGGGAAIAQSLRPFSRIGLSEIVKSRGSLLYPAATECGD